MRYESSSGTITSPSWSLEIHFIRSDTTAHLVNFLSWTDADQGDLALLCHSLRPENPNWSDQNTLVNKDASPPQYNRCDTMGSLAHKPNKIWIRTLEQCHLWKAQCRMLSGSLVEAAVTSPPSVMLMQVSTKFTAWDARTSTDVDTHTAVPGGV